MSYYWNEDWLGNQFADLCHTAQENFYRGCDSKTAGCGGGGGLTDCKPCHKCGDDLGRDGEPNCVFTVFITKGRFHCWGWLCTSETDELSSLLSFDAGAFVSAIDEKWQQSASESGWHHNQKLLWPQRGGAPDTLCDMTKLVNHAAHSTARARFMFLLTYAVYTVTTSQQLEEFNGQWAQGRVELLGNISWHFTYITLTACVCVFSCFHVFSWSAGLCSHHPPFHPVQQDG